MNSNIKLYLKQVSDKLNCPKAKKTDIIGQLKSEIAADTADHTTVSLDELYAKFGTPDEVAVGFFNRTEYDSQMVLSKKKNKRWKAFAITACLLVILAVLFSFWVAHEFGGIATVSDAMYNNL